MSMRRKYFKGGRFKVELRENSRGEREADLLSLIGVDFQISIWVHYLEHSSPVSATATIGTYKNKRTITYRFLNDGLRAVDSGWGKVRKYDIDRFLKNAMDAIHAKMLIGAIK